MRHKGAGQTWSLDLILAVGVFILFIIAFYAILSNQEASITPTDVQQKANTLADRLGAQSGDPAATVIIDGEINETKLGELSKKDIAELKQIFGVGADFCIYLEDENGRLIPVNGTRTGVGSGKISIDGTPCNATIP